jgi:hypothetical protein
MESPIEDHVIGQKVRPEQRLQILGKLGKRAVHEYVSAFGNSARFSCKSSASPT